MNECKFSKRESAQWCHAWKQPMFSTVPPSSSELGMSLCSTAVPRCCSPPPPHLPHRRHVRTYLLRWRRLGPHLPRQRRFGLQLFNLSRLAAPALEPPVAGVQRAPAAFGEDGRGAGERVTQPSLKPDDSTLPSAYPSTREHMLLLGRLLQYLGAPFSEYFEEIPGEEAPPMIGVIVTGIPLNLAYTLDYVEEWRTSNDYLPLQEVAKKAIHTLLVNS